MRHTSTVFSFYVNANFWRFAYFRKARGRERA